jgi:Na+-translocating ferredoxin:NAD+ oxidoreductase RNF subunit RnfB
MQQNGSGESQALTQPERDSVGLPDGLTDEDLIAGGFLKVQAYTRSKTSATANAARSKRARQKASDKGLSQLNVLAPTTAHAAMKAIAKELQAGQPMTDALQSCPLAAVQLNDPTATIRVMTGLEAAAVETVAAKLLKLKGWRLWLARLFRLL